MKIKYIDLFSGIGGFRYSLIQACKKNNIKCSCVGYSEIDKYAIKTYKANFGDDEEELSLGDITKITGKELNKTIPDFDFLFAGFPCQPFSLMGKGKGFADTRGTLFFHIEKILTAKKPKFFLLENVKGLVTHDEGKTFDSIINILEKKLGYNIISWVLNSSDYGVPQTRRRVYILGFSDPKLKTVLSEPPDRINITKTETPTTWHLLEKNVDPKYYLSKKLLKTIVANGSGNYYSKSEINLTIARPLCATMHKMHRASQDNYFSDRFIKGKYDKRNNKIIENKKYPNKIRKITPLEAFRLHGFPDQFVVKAKEAGVSDTQLYRQAGNAITVKVVEKILQRVVAEII